MPTSAFKDDERNPLMDESQPTDLAVPLIAADDDAYEGLSSRMAWRVAAALFAAAGIGCLVELATGWFGASIENESMVLALAVSSLVLSAIWLFISRRDVDDRWLHVGILISYGILAGVLSQAPNVESHLGIVYLVPLTFVALFLPARALIFYIGLSITFIAYSMIHHAGEQYGVVPGIMAIAALVSTAFLTLYVRLQLDSIGRQAALLSGRDALTGLSNLRPLYERVEQLVRRAERGETGVTVIMLDLEGFKRVNDQYSHSVGDETLRVVAKAMADSVRRDEMVARRGGDEFAIVTETTDEEELETLIRRISHHVSDVRIDMLPDVRSGVTSGYATFREGDTVGQLLARADRKLHEAKAAAKLERWSWRARKLDDLADEYGFGD
ncbi:MAG: GGDEF domain-containing protein [Solirubrobacterales bacterium]